MNMLSLHHLLLNDILKLPKHCIIQKYNYKLQRKRLSKKKKKLKGKTIDTFNKITSFMKNHNLIIFINENILYILDIKIFQYF